MFQRLVALALICVGSAQAAIHVDPSFGDGGKVDVVLPAPFQEYDYFFPPQVVVGADRKVTVARSPRSFGGTGTAPPQVVLVRRNADGSADTGFGSNGIQVLTLQTAAVSYFKPLSLTLLSDGDLLLFGQSVLLDPADPSMFLESKLLLTRLNADGAPDPAFNGGNTLALDGLPPGYPRLMPQGDGVLVFSLERFESYTWGAPPAGFSVMRIGADGRPDPAFAAAGVLTVPPSSGWASDAMLLPDGGFQLLYVLPPRSGVAPRNWWRRYRAGGALDTAFGNNGEQEIENILAHGNIQPQQLQPLPDGRVLAMAHLCILRLFDAQGATLQVLPRNCINVGMTNARMQWYGDKVLVSAEQRFGGVPPPSDGTYLTVIDANGATDTGFGDLTGSRWRPPDRPNDSFGVAADGGAHFVLARRTSTGFRIFRYQDVRGGNPIARPVPALAPLSCVVLLSGLLLLAARRQRAGL